MQKIVLDTNVLVSGIIGSRHLPLPCPRRTQRATIGSTLPAVPGIVTIPQEKEMLQREIESTDQAIDVLVYQLYGLNDAEIKIVETT